MIAIVMITAAAATINITATTTPRIATVFTEPEIYVIAWFVVVFARVTQEVIIECYHMLILCQIAVR